MKLIMTGDYAPDYIRGQVTTDFASRLLAEIKPTLDSADFRFLNAESIMIEEGIGEKIAKTGPNLHSAPSDISPAIVGKFDVAVVANNHFGDFGPDAVAPALATLRNNGIQTVGGGCNKQDAYRSVILEKDGVRISVLAVCENEFGCATDTLPGSAGFDLKYLADRIAEERKNADFILLFFHGGNEYNPLPSPATVDRYRLLIDLGADAVIAGHTHCMQGYEYYKDKPIVYSMGNFFFPDNADPKDSWNYGYVTEMNIDRDLKATLSLHPYRVEENCRIHVFEGREKDVMLSYIDNLSSFIDNREELVRYFEGWCLRAGTDYATCIHYHPLYERNDHSFEKRQWIARIRNLFTCESHNYLMNTLLRMEQENRFGQASDYLEKLLQMQKMPL